MEIESNQKFVSYNLSGYDPDKFKKPCEYSKGHFKPDGGLWASPEITDFDWKHFTDGDSYGMPCCDVNKFEFSLSDNARILTLSDIDNVADFVSKYCILDTDAIGHEVDNVVKWVKDNEDGIMSWFNFRIKEVDWDAVRRDYDVIGADPYNDMDMYDILYGWDCASIIVLNNEVIEPIKDMSPDKINDGNEWLNFIRKDPYSLFHMPPEYITNEHIECASDKMGSIKDIFDMLQHRLNSSHRIFGASEYTGETLAKINDIVKDMFIDRRLKELGQPVLDDNLKNKCIANVKLDGECLQYMPDSCKADKDIVEVAVSNTPYAIRYASDEIQHDIYYLTELAEKYPKFAEAIKKGQILDKETRNSVLIELLKRQQVKNNVLEAKDKINKEKKSIVDMDGDRIDKYFTVDDLVKDTYFDESRLGIPDSEYISDIDSSLEI